MNADRIAAIAESTPLVKRLHDATRRADDAAGDLSVVQAWLQHLRQAVDALELAVMLRDGALPTAVLTRYRDALIVIDEAGKDLLCAFCQRAPIAVQHPDGDFRCAECAEKVEAR